uniref:26S proteasome ATPase subunit n=1 Tax=Rhizophora mucronata TaxID=61149 RepID=A0A2P2M6S4_RHIMU
MEEKQANKKLDHQKFKTGKKSNAWINYHINCK